MKVTLKLEPRPIGQPGSFQTKTLENVVKVSRTDYKTHAYVNFEFFDGSSESVLEEIIRSRRDEP